MSIAVSHPGLTQPLPKGIVRLTTPEFRKAALALDPKVAVFDCDGTLWSGDAGSHFMNWSMDQGLLRSEEHTSELQSL